MLGTVLAVHIGMGTLGLLLGVATLLFRKGAERHRVAGTVFVLAMLFLGTSASILAIAKSLPDRVVGVLAVYFVSTAWMAAHRKDGETGTFEIAAFVAALAGGIAMFSFAVLDAYGVIKAKNSDIAIAYKALSVLLTFAALADLSVIWRHGLSGGQRIARHLWRMCFGFFIAVGSFAAQGSKMLPPSLHASRIFFPSVIVIAVVMFFWLVRVLFTNWYRRGGQTS